MSNSISVPTQVLCEIFLVLCLYSEVERGGGERPQKVLSIHIYYKLMRYSKVYLNLKEPQTNFKHPLKKRLI